MELREAASIDEARSRTAAVLVIDVVESVRLVASDAVGFASAWGEFSQRVETDLCPRFSVSFIKSLGDGMLVTLGSATEAVLLAVAVRDLAAESLGRLPPPLRFSIRCGVDEGPLVFGARDVYGTAANLAARLAGLAREGQIVISEAVRRAMPPEFEGETTDLGDCHLRNLPEPVRAHAIGSARPVGGRPLLIPDSALRPVIAVIPPAGDGVGAALSAAGEAFADEVILELGRSGALNVVSRLSTRRLLATPADLAGAARRLLAADYVLFGHVRQRGDRIEFALELSVVPGGRVLWVERVEEPAATLFNGERAAAYGVAERVIRTVLRTELEKSRAASLPTLANYTLLLSGISAMYSLSRPEFERARELLEVLGDRASRQATALAWLAKWHVMRAVQGWSTDRGQDAAAALALTARALDADPENALALTVEGLVHTNLRRRFDLAEASLSAALDRNPNEPLAWLIRGALHSFTDRGPEAVQDTMRARQLSPLDPHRHYQLALAAGAHLTAGEDEQARVLAEASWRANRLHLSTLRILAVARWRLGREAEAREAVRRLLALDPGFTVSAYLASAPAAAYRVGQDVARALRAAGVPP